MFGNYYMTNYAKVVDFNQKNGKFATGFKNRTEIKNALKLVTEEYNELINNTSDENMLNEAADLLYVTYGIFAVLGIDADEVFREVHWSNMSKMTNGKFLKDKNNKVIKGPDYRSANIRQFI